MRDGSIDHDTGWLYDGYYDRKAPDLSTGIAGLGESRAPRGSTPSKLAKIPPPGRKYIADAMADPEARPILQKLLASSSNPSVALANQANQDLAESINPTGKVIVFKSLVARLAPRLKSMVNQVSSAADPKSEHGRAVRFLIATSKDPHQEVQKYLTAVAYDAIAPGTEYVDWVDEGHVSGLGFSLKKTVKRVAAATKRIINDPTTKKVAIGAAIVVGAAITAGVILPAVAPVIGAGAAAVFGGVKSIFGGGSSPAAVGAGGAAGAAVGPGGKVIIGYDSMGMPVYQGDPIPSFGFQPLTQAQVQAQQKTTAGGEGSGLNLASLASAALAVYKVKMTGDVQKAAAQQQYLVEQLKAQGMSDAQAKAMVGQAMDQVAQQYPGQPSAPAGGPPPGSGPAEAGMFSSDVVKYALIGVAGIAVVHTLSTQMGGGGRGGARRRPRRR